ncbi:MAG: hypothetical protein KJ052_01940 [Candidatus Hydrogenedentes bacterium]|nr:hypothetical protein [Candidatus Hydrogenedentota bacterium]
MRIAIPVASEPKKVTFETREGCAIFDVDRESGAINNAFLFSITVLDNAFTRMVRERVQLLITPCIRKTSTQKLRSLGIEVVDGMYGSSPLQILQHYIRNEHTRENASCVHHDTNAA